MVIIFALLIVFSTSGNALAQEASWSDEGELGYKRYGEQHLDIGQATPLELLGPKKNCFKTEFVIRAERKIPSLPLYLQKEVRKTVCATALSSGFIGGGYFLKHGTSTAGKIQSDLSHKPRLIPVAGTGTVIELYTNSLGTRMYIVKDAFAKAAVKTDSLRGTVKYFLPSQSAGFVKTTDGRLFSIGSKALSLSSNNKWLGMVGSTLGSGAVNLTNGEITGFKRDVSLGSSTGIYSAISGNGRYLAMSAYRPAVIRVYDLANCSTNGKCASVDVQKLLKQKNPTYAGGASQLEFKGDILNFAGVHNQIKHGMVGNSRTWARYSISPPGTSPDTSKIDYLAMGDSFASGEGAYKYYPNTDTEANKCHLSTVSYPFLINSPNAETVKSVACSGGKIKDVIYTDLVKYKKNDPQDKSRLENSYDDEIFNNYIPGNRGQLAFVEKKQPKIVTISMVGNDIGFGAILRRCVAGADTCYGLPPERSALISIINNQYNKLVKMYADIKTAMPTDGKAYVIGYPQVAIPGGNCAVNVNLNNQEIMFTKNLISYLNRTIEMAASQAGVKYISTEDAFDKHRMCETNSSSVAVNGLDGVRFERYGKFMGIRYSKGVFGIKLKTESYHPNQLGHRLYAATISQKTNSFTEPMPTQTISNPKQKDQAYYDLYGVTEDDENTYNSYYEDNLAPGALVKNIPFPVIVQGVDYGLKPSSDYQVVVHSDPTTVGVITSDASGNLDGELSVPVNITPGYHTLHITGKNIVDEDVDIQKIVYVAETEDDIDGDGIKNDDETCLLVEPVNIDKDQDGIDDACDGFIDEPPAVEPPEDTGVIDVPGISNTTKNLPISESRPEWLIQLEKQIQAENELKRTQEQQNSALVTNQGPTNSPTASTGEQLPQNSAEPNTIATEAEPTTPSTQPVTSSITEVKAATNNQYTQPDQKKTSKIWIPVTLALISTATVVFFIIRYLRQQPKS